MLIALASLAILAHTQPSPSTYRATPLGPSVHASLPLLSQSVVRTFPDGTVFGQSVYHSTGKPATVVSWRYQSSFEPLVTTSPSGSTSFSLGSVNAAGDAAGSAGREIWVWSKGKVRWITLNAPPGFENSKLSHRDVQIHDSGVVSGTATFEGKAGSIAWVSDRSGQRWVGLASKPYVWSDNTLVSRVVDIRPDGTVVGVSVPAPTGSLTPYLPPMPWTGRDAIGVGWILRDGRYAEFSPSTTRKGATPLASPLGRSGSDRYLVRMASGVGVADLSGRITPLPVADGFNEPSFDLGPASADGARFTLTSMAGRGPADQEESKQARHWFVSGSRAAELRAPLFDVIGGGSLRCELRVLLDSNVVIGTVNRRETNPTLESTFFAVAVKWTDGSPSAIRPADVKRASDFHASVLHFDKPAGNRFIVGDQFVSTQPQTKATILTSPRKAWLYDIQKDAVVSIAHPDHPGWSILPLAVSSNGTAFLRVTEGDGPPRYYTWSQSGGFTALAITRGSKSMSPEVLRIREILDDEGKRFIASFTNDPEPANRTNVIPCRRILNKVPATDLHLLER